MSDSHTLSDSQPNSGNNVSPYAHQPPQISLPSIDSPAGPSSQRRLTLNDIHIPAGFEIAHGLGENGSEYPSQDKIQKAAEVLKSLRGKLPSATDGQIAACDYCRRRKIKCDRVKPTCGSCVQSGKTCTTEDVLRKRGPPSKREKAILEQAGIIFRGTRPHRRRRTTIDHVSSTSVRSFSNDRISAKIDKASRSRSFSTNSKSLSLKPEEWASKGGSWWLEMLSAASESSYPYQDSPGHSPSVSSSMDHQGMDGGACDYLPDLPEPPLSQPCQLNTYTAQWENMWATFGNAIRQKHAPEDDPARMMGLFGTLNTETAFPSSGKSLDAAALDWASGAPSIEVQHGHLVPPTCQPPNLIAFPDPSLPSLSTSIPWDHVMPGLIESPYADSALDSNSNTSSSLLPCPTSAMVSASAAQSQLLGIATPGTVSL